MSTTTLALLPRGKSPIPPWLFLFSTEERNKTSEESDDTSEESNDMSEEIFLPHVEIGKFLRRYSLFSRLVLPNSPTIKQHIKE